MVSDSYTTEYAWDYRNRLTTVTHYADYTAFGGNSPDKTVTYTYDVFNRLVGEKVTLGNGSWTNTVWVYDGNQVVLQFDSSGTTGSASALTAGDLSHRYLWGPAVDQLLADEQLLPASGGGYDLTQPGTVAWALTDNQGTVRDLAIYNASTGTTTGSPSTAPTPTPTMPMGTRRPAGSPTAAARPSRAPATATSPHTPGTTATASPRSRIMPTTRPSAAIRPIRPSRTPMTR